VEGKPGGGFFGLAKDLGKLKGNDAATRDAFWKAEKEAVYRIWQRTFPKPGT
jgi:hypothetical protein